jgi:hypothetical protein
MAYASRPVHPRKVHQYLERFPKDRYPTEIESWRHLQSDIIEFTMKPLRCPSTMVADRGWKRPFDDPIRLPRGRQLVTLKVAAKYIQKLPKAEQQLEEWQAAFEALPPGCRT